MCPIDIADEDFIPTYSSVEYTKPSPPPKGSYKPKLSPSEPIDVDSTVDQNVKLKDPPKK